MRAAAPWIAAVAGLAVAACSPGMEPVSLISKVRVMAVQAEPPEVRPGEGTTLRVLYADPEGNGRPVTVSWLACAGSLAPTAELSDAGQGCEIVGVPQILEGDAGGDLYRIEAVPEDLLDAGTGAPPTGAAEPYADITVVVGLCAGGTLPPVDQMMQVGEIDEIGDLCEGGDGLVATKIVRVSNAKTPNANPVIDKLLFDKEEVAPGGESKPYQCTDPNGCRDQALIQAFLTPESFQPYEVTEFGKVVSKEESPYLSWFVTDGKLNDSRSRAAKPPGPFETKWRPPIEGGESRLWVVAHDARGGTSWQSYAISAAR